MVITELSALDFRNYKELLVQFSSRVNLIVGNNGQGKTNLAEAIYFLNHLDSFRTHRLADLVRIGQQNAFLQCTVLNNDIPHKARVEITPQGRRAWLDEEAIRRQSAYAASFYALLFNPDSLYNYRHYPGERRHFYDRFLAFYDGEYLEHLRTFRTIHAQKNAALKSGAETALPEWNYLFVQKACDIIKRRSEIIDRINELLDGIYRRLTGREGRLALQYHSSLSGEQARDEAILRKNAEREKRAGHALYGPHRDDYELNLGDRKGESYLSQGEYRISILAMKMALNDLMRQTKGFHPLVILDDLYSELDENIRKNLNEYLEEIPNQVFITTTEAPETIGLRQARIMEVGAGAIQIRSS
ncbi:MAG: DNA replication and repair protein RecF [Deltaproteobacteria bacterium]|nr:DNA replication and repair protein RecF [Deltaproteobacteria bacterium]